MQWWQEAGKNEPRVELVQMVVDVPVPSCYAPVNDANYEQWGFLTKAAFNSCKSYPVAALHSFLKS